MKKEEIKQDDKVKAIFRKYGKHIVVGKVFEISTDEHTLKGTWISIRVTGGDTNDKHVAWMVVKKINVMVLLAMYWRWLVMDKIISISEWIDKFNNGEFTSKLIKTQISAGWYDWFCKDRSLSGKTIKMGNIIKQIKVGGKVDINNWYVWFKNNCPLNGSLYDDFRFADLASGDVMFTIQIDCCWNLYRFSVYGRTPDGEDIVINHYSNVIQ